MVGVAQYRLVVLLVKEGTTLNVRMERGREKRERYR